MNLTKFASKLYKIPAIKVRGQKEDHGYIYREFGVFTDKSKIDLKSLQKENKDFKVLTIPTHILSACDSVTNNDIHRFYLPGLNLMGSNSPSIANRFYDQSCPEEELLETLFQEIYPVHYGDFFGENSCKTAIKRYYEMSKKNCLILNTLYPNPSQMC